MKIDYQKMHDIITESKSQNSNLETRLYWRNERGVDMELSFEEKNMVAIIRAMNLKLGLGLEMDYGRNN